MISRTLTTSPYNLGAISRFRGFDLPVLLGLALLIVVVRGSSFGNPVADFDDQLYSFIGERMLHGELPFVDWFDRKPFGLFAIFAFAHAIGGPSEVAYQALAMLFTLGGALLTYHLARSLADRVGAFTAAAFYVVLMSTYSGNSGQSEAFFVPLMMAAMALVRDPTRVDAGKRALWAMTLCGAVLQIKYTVLPQCAFLGSWSLWGQFRRGVGPANLAKSASLYAALGVAPTVLVGLFYLAVGGWDEFWFANFVSFFERNASMESRFHISQLTWIVPLALPLLSAVYCALRVEAPRDPPRYFYYVLWSCSVVATVLLPKTIYLFYLASLAPCVALLATPFYSRGTLLRAGPAVILLAFTIHILDLPERYTREAAERRDFALLAAKIAQHVDGQSRCLYVYDGPTALYRASGGCTMTRLIYPDHINNALETGAVGVDQATELTRILANKPAVIVTASRAVTPQNPQTTQLIEQATKRDYQPIARARVDIRIITAWARRQPSSSGPDTTATTLKR